MLNPNLSAHLLGSIDRAQNYYKNEGVKSSEALKKVLKELEVSPQEYWDLCQTDIKFKETH